MSVLWSQIENDPAIVLKTPVPEFFVTRNGARQRISLFDIRYVKTYLVTADKLQLGADAYYELELEQKKFLKITYTPQEIGVKSMWELDQTLLFLGHLEQLCSWFEKGQLIDNLYMPSFKAYARWISEKLGVDIAVSRWDKDSRIY